MVPKKLTKYIFAIFLALSTWLFFVDFVFATDYSSASYKVMDPVLMPAGYATSSSYSLTSTVAQISIGTSTSALWKDQSGFEYFPFVNIPVLSGLAGDTQVSLSWTASVGVLGWTVSGYNIGRSVISGGPYTYTSVGAVLSSAVTGLTNGTPYYFIVRPEDAFGNSIATSSETTATPPPPPPSSGGGAPPLPSPQGQPGTLVLSGRAYPNTRVMILLGGSVVRILATGGNPNFATTLSQPAGDYQLAIFAEDVLGRRSALFGTVVHIPSAGTQTLSSIFLSPTLALDKDEVQRGEFVAMNGFAYPGSDVLLFVSPDARLVDGVRTTRVVAGRDGRYTYRFPTDTLSEALYHVRTRASFQAETSGLSRPQEFTVGKETKIKDLACMPGDLNTDLRVDLTDFSIAVFWYKKPLSGAFVDKEKNCLNNDKKIDLYDFSLMAYYWTG
jgi:hypothetical protein